MDFEKRKSWRLLTKLFAGIYAADARRDRAAERRSSSRTGSVMMFFARRDLSLRRARDLVIRMTNRPSFAEDFFFSRYVNAAKSVDGVASRFRSRTSTAVNT